MDFSENYMADTLLGVDSQEKKTLMGVCIVNKIFSVKIQKKCLKNRKIKEKKLLERIATDDN